MRTRCGHMCRGGDSLKKAFKMRSNGNNFLLDLVILRGPDNVASKLRQAVEN
jgi:hypothetical protein